MHRNVLLISCKNEDNVCDIKLQREAVTLEAQSIHTRTDIHTCIMPVSAAMNAKVFYVTTHTTYTTEIFIFLYSHQKISQYFVALKENVL